MEENVYRLDYQKKYGGFLLKLVKRNDNVAMFAKYLGDVIISYEVFKIKTKINKCIMNREIKKYQGYTHYELYPCDNDFGRFAWDIGGKDCFTRANQKYIELSNNND